MYLVYADHRGKLYDHPELFGLGRSGESLMEILEEELIPLPEGATLVSLPNCHPVGMDPETGEMIRLEEYQAVGALMPQGFTRLMLPGYVKADKDEKLPLFGYTAVVWHNDGFYVAAEQSDDPYKWNPLNFPEDEKERLVKNVLEQYPENRVFNHLSNCTLGYGCLTASNTFFNRWEAGLPVSYSCNAGCYGCIS